jgi:predicted transcriptional regulator
VIEGAAAPSRDAAIAQDIPVSPAQADEHVEARPWRALGDDFVLMKDVRPPPRFAHARERVLMCRLYLGLIRTISDDYGAPFAGHTDSASFRAIGIYVFFRTVMCAPVQASCIAHALRLPRAVVLRRLQDLIKQGYVERVGNAYRITEKVNIADLGDKIQTRIEMIAETARKLAELRTAMRGETAGAPQSGEP